jgi:proteic killer suppression protein
VIRTFRHKGLERLFRKSDARGIPADRVKRILRMLDRLDVAERPADMNLPGWQFHSLKGAMKGRFACSVSGNFRLTFTFDGKDAVDVDLEDYH